MLIMHNILKLLNVARLVRCKYVIQDDLTWNIYKYLKSQFNTWL